MLVACMLELRGVNPENTAAFFQPQLDDLHDPLLMLGMEQAVDRLMSAQREGERIMVYGDYDVDGATSVALMQEFLQNNGFEILPYIPDRYNEGYGL